MIFSSKYIGYFFIFLIAFTVVLPKVHASGYCSGFASHCPTIRSTDTCTKQQGCTAFISNHQTSCFGTATACSAFSEKGSCSRQTGCSWKKPRPTYLGCYKDQGESHGTKGRDLNGYYFQSSKMTPKKCSNACSSRRYKYFGVQFAEHCFCGTSYGRSGSATNCSMACAGDSSKTCGGAWANDIYQINQ